MCGIAAFAGSKPAAEFVYDALKRLEYRGYDSWGMAVAHPGSGTVHFTRQVGAPSEASKAVALLDFDCPVGIGHTRWATHGKVSEQNCHPVEGGRPWLPNDRVYVVHNGVVENHAELRPGLRAGGWNYKTETDTETLAHLLSARTAGAETNDEFFSGVAEAVDRLKGQYAFVAIHRGWLGKGLALFGVSKGAPLCVTGAGHVASDPGAFAGHASRYVRVPANHAFAIWLAHGEHPRVTFIDLAHVRDPKVPAWSEAYFDEVVPEACEQGKGGHPHFMLKEIMEQPEALAEPRTWFGSEGERPDQFVLLGCGSSYNACLLARGWFESVTGVQTTVEYASEFAERNLDAYPRDALFVGVTQSGETKDTVLAMERVARSERGRRLGLVTNNPHSSAAKVAGWHIRLGCGPEYGVAATKTFTATACALAEVATSWARGHGRLLHSVLRRSLPAKLASLLTPEFVSRQQWVAGELARHKRVLFLGRGANYAVAREGALKMKEVSYVHAEAMPAAEMKHGPIALVDHDTAAVFILGADVHDPSHAKSLANMEEVKARGGFVVAVADDATVKPACADLVVTVPASCLAVHPLVANAALQVLAYHAATIRGLNPDRPRNLAKSVTVE